MGIRELNQVREILFSLPEVSEKSSPRGAISFFIPNKKTICYYHDHHHDGRVSLWCPTYPDLKKDLIRNKPKVFFQPHTSSAGSFGEWLGIYLDTSDENSVNWNLISRILEDAFRKTATKKLISKLWAPPEIDLE